MAAVYLYTSFMLWYYSYALGSFTDLTTAIVGVVGAEVLALFGAICCDVQFHIVK